MPSEPDSTPPSIRLLVTGARGQLGTDLVALARHLDIPCTAMASADLDITDEAAVAAAVAEFAAAARGQRAVLINAAAYTAVDAAETDRETAFAVNVAGPG